LKSETLVRTLFEKIYFADFTKNRKPKWLVNQFGHQLEFDGYNEKLKIAFEHQGLQHYKFPNKFHKTRKQFNIQQENDNRKRNLCRRRGITLIEIPQLSNRSILIRNNPKIYTTKYYNLCKLIIFKLRKSRRQIPKEIYNTYISSDLTVKKKSKITTFKNRYGKKFGITICIIFTLPIFALWLGNYYE